MQLGELQRVKSLHHNGGPLSKELMRPSMRLERPSFINSGVPLSHPATTHKSRSHGIITGGSVPRYRLGMLFLGSKSGVGQRVFSFAVLLQACFVEPCC